MGWTPGVELTFEDVEPHPVRTKSAKAARQEKDKVNFIQVSMAGLGQHYRCRTFGAFGKHSGARQGGRR